MKFLTYKNLICVLFGLSLIPIVESVHLGIFGDHAIRQSDAYSNILGFMGRPDFHIFANFEGGQNLFDMPIYSYIVAQFAKLFVLAPLIAARYFNIFLFCVLAFSGSQLLLPTGGLLAAGIFIFSLGISPLLMHFFSTPLPDLLAITLDVVALSLTILPKTKSHWHFVAAGTCLFLSSFIKSPIGFVFLVFYGTYELLVLQRHSLAEKKRHLFIMILFGIFCLCAAASAEMLRSALAGGIKASFAQDPHWYFGTWQMRFAKSFWATFADRFKDFGIPSLPIFILVSIAAIKNREARVFFLSTIAAVLAGWLVFANVYFIHNYYQLPICILVILSTALSLSHIFKAFLPPEKLQKHQILMWCFVLSVFFVVKILQEDKSRKDLTNIYSVISIVMKGQQTSLLVINPIDHSPEIGGWIGGHITHFISKKDFSQNCISYLNNYKYFLTYDHENFCLQSI